METTSLALEYCSLIDGETDSGTIKASFREDRWLISPLGSIKRLVDDADNLQLLVSSTGRLQQMHVDPDDLIMVGENKGHNSVGLHLWYVTVMDCHG